MPRRERNAERIRAMLAAGVDDAELTDAVRAALNARDRALMERFLARDEAAEREMVQRLDAMGRLVARLLWWRIFWDWEEYQGEYFATLARYREEGKLRLDESLRYLAQRLLRHVGRKTGIEEHRDRMALSFDGKATAEQGEAAAEQNSAWAVWLEREAAASVAAEPRFVNAEEAVGSRQQLQSLEAVAAKLPPTERATYEAEMAVANGDHESLAEALGVSQGHARVLRFRMKTALLAAAVELGASDLVERLDARKQRKRSK